MIVMFWLLSQDKVISVCLKMAESFSSKKWDSTAKEQVKSHLSARRSKLEDQFTSLLPVSEWPQEPYEIEFFKKSWSNMALKNKEQWFPTKTVWNGPGLVQNDPEAQNIISKYMYYR